MYHRSQDIAIRKAVSLVVVGFFIVFPTMYLSLFYKMTLRSSIVESLKMYSPSLINNTCRKNNKLLSCYRKYFFKNLYNANILESYFLLQTELEIFSSEKKINIQEQQQLLKSYFQIFFSKNIRNYTFYTGNYLLKLYLSKYKFNQILKQEIKNTNNLKLKIALLKIKNNIRDQT